MILENISTKKREKGWVWVEKKEYNKKKSNQRTMKLEKRERVEWWNSRVLHVGSWNEMKWYDTGISWYWKVEILNDDMRIRIE